MWIEYSASQGEGTLIEHGIEFLEPHEGIDLFYGDTPAVKSIIAQTITPDEATQFQAMHGGNVAT